ncbi:MAG: choice-of-anchor Q domain-containing protein, partial [Acidimicrobiales bacterium]
RGNRVERVPHTGIAIGDLRAGSSHNIRVKKNFVREANYQFRNPGRLGGWGSGISVVGSVGVRILKNDVRRSYGEGINCPLTDRCTVRRNVVVDAYNALFYADNATNSVWEDNVAKTSGDGRFHLDYGFGPFEASGFVFGNETGWYSGSPNPISGNIVRNNVVINAHRGVGFLDFGSGRGMRNTRIANNTFVNVRCGTDFSSSSGSGGNEFVNNIVVPASNGRPTCTSTSGVTYRHNLWASGRPGTAGHTTDERGNPGFVGGPALSAASYKLAAASPAINEGRTLSYVNDDRTRRSRPQRGAYDIGAFEH